MNQIQHQVWEPRCWELCAFLFQTLVFFPGAPFPVLVGSPRIGQSGHTLRDRWALSHSVTQGALHSVCFRLSVWKNERYHLLQGIGKGWLMSRTLKSTDKKAMLVPSRNCRHRGSSPVKKSGPLLLQTTCKWKGQSLHSQQLSYSHRLPQLPPRAMCKNTCLCEEHVAEYFFMRLTPNVPTWDLPQVWNLLVEFNPIVIFPWTLNTLYYN